MVSHGRDDVEMTGYNRNVITSRPGRRTTQVRLQPCVPKVRSVTKLRCHAVAGLGGVPRGLGGFQGVSGAVTMSRCHSCHDCHKSHTIGPNLKNL